MPVIWRAQTLVNLVGRFIWILSTHKFCIWKGNSYKCIFNKVRRKNNCPCLFSANSSLRGFSKTWQYYFNTKRWFSLAQAVSKTGPKSIFCNSDFLALLNFEFWKQIWHKILQFRHFFSQIWVFNSHFFLKFWIKKSKLWDNCESGKNNRD